MCGIFAYMGHQPIPITQVLRVLHMLENEQEPDEKTPVGGHGAGIAYLNTKGNMLLTKAGRTNTSPVIDLERQMPDSATSSTLVLGHVRRASPEFDTTIPYSECTQPYKPTCTNAGFTVFSAHNGFLQNYPQLKSQLIQKHQFESENHTLVDSEVIAHLYEEQLNQTKNPTKAANTLYEQIEGNNTIILITVNKDQVFLNAIHEGKTRGIIIWTNPNGEAILCSREQPLQKALHTFLTEGNYQKILTIHRTDTANIQTNFNLKHPHPCPP